MLAALAQASGGGEVVGAVGEVALGPFHAEGVQAGGLVADLAQRMAQPLGASSGR